MIYFTSDLHLGHPAIIHMRNLHNNNNMQYDVGVDANRFYPVSIETIRKYFEHAGG